MNKTYNRKCRRCDGSGKISTSKKAKCGASIGAVCPCCAGKGWH